SAGAARCVAERSARLDSLPLGPVHLAEFQHRRQSPCVRRRALVLAFLPSPRRNGCRQDGVQGRVDSTRRACRSNGAPCSPGRWAEDLEPVTCVSLLRTLPLAVSRTK